MVITVRSNVLGFAYVETVEMQLNFHSVELIFNIVVIILF